MLSMKPFKFFIGAVHCLLIVYITEGFENASMPMYLDTISVSDVNKVLIDFSERMRLYQLVDQVAFEKPLMVPSCPKEHIYDAVEAVCAEAYNQEHCGDNMIFLPVPNSEDLGACACTNMASLKRWGRPQVLTAYNQCAEIGTRGPCNVGEAMVPITKFHAECGVDACIQMKPDNAINFSEGPKLEPFLYPAFNFTYKGKCFTTESEAFCQRGQVVRFILPYKIPACVDRNEVELPPRQQSPVGGSVQQPALRDCEPGAVANPITGICQPVSSFDFE